MLKELYCNSYESGDFLRLRRSSIKDTRPLRLNNITNFMILIANVLAMNRPPMDWDSEAIEINE
jgi:hypothetical protein